MSPKSTRNRSEEDKQKQLAIIVEQAIQLYSKEKLNFSMNNLANQSGLGSASSLYRYVSGKNELWKLICNHDFRLFEKGMRKVVQQINQPDQVVRALGQFFIEFATEDFDRFERMFFTPPPPDLTDNTEDLVDIDSNNHETLRILVQSVQQALKYHNINLDPVMVAHYLWALVLGSSILLYPSTKGLSAPYLDTQQQAEKFKKFVLDHSNQLYSKS